VRKNIILFLPLLILSLGNSAYAKDKGDVYYERVKTEYLEFFRSGTKQKSSSEWDKIINEFQTVANAYPGSGKAPDALYMTGELSLEAYKRFNKDRFLEKAILAYSKLSREYSKSSLADDAQLRVADIMRLYRKDYKRSVIEYKRLIDKFPKGDQLTKAKFWLDKLIRTAGVFKPAEQKPPNVSVTGIETWSGENYTRVSITLSGNAEFDHSILQEDEGSGRPKRIMVNIKNAVIKPDLKEPIPIKDDLLQQIRSGQFSSDAVRIVMDLRSIGEYNLFYFDSPFRIIVDIFSEGKQVSDVLDNILRESDSVAVKNATEETKQGVSSLVLAKPMPHIFIDPGHGGEDPGALSYSRKIMEKDVVLGIAKELRKILESKGYRVSLSRENDVFIPLPQRTAMANKADTDFFVSIHANASRKRSAVGMETYFFDLSSDKDVLKLAAMENGVSIDKLDTLQFILTDMERTPIRNQSSMLASSIQNGLWGVINSHGVNTKNLGTKHGPFYVLKGARMPSVLVETAFITNPKEERLLSSDGYRKRLAEGISQGIEKYIKTIDLNPVAFLP